MVVRLDFWCYANATLCLDAHITGQALIQSEDDISSKSTRLKLNYQFSAPGCHIPNLYKVWKY